MGQNAGTLGRYSPIDLFRYASPGVLDLVPANSAYFSIDGGTTVLHTFNGPNGGDLSDWLKGPIADSYDVGPTLGSEMVVSSEDVTLMDVIGYDVAVPPLSGDYNGNGVVDAADYTVWRDTLGSTTDLRANGDSTGSKRGRCRSGRLQSLENEFCNARWNCIEHRRKCRCSGASDFVDALHRNHGDCLLPTLSPTIPNRTECFVASWQVFGELAVFGGRYLRRTGCGKSWSKEFAVSATNRRPFLNRTEWA